MIVGGFTGGGSSNSTHKRYVHSLKTGKSVSAEKKVMKSLPPVTVDQ